ncbi:MAG: hypothetical protein ACI9R3_003842 [Verrucomicrobiales bacterium]|jgi:uncharacterized protein YbaP (TraB family)
MFQSRSQRGGVSPFLIILAGALLLVVSVAAIVFVNRSAGPQVESGRLYRGIVFEAVAPEVEGEEERARVLLIGSMHFLRPDDYPLPESYEQAFEQADAVFFELKSGQKTSDLVQVHSTYDDGSSMREHLSDALYRRASAAAVEQGISMESFAHRRPHALAQALSAIPLIRAGFTRSWGVDTYFRTKASEVKKPMMAFEFLEEQLAVFSSLSDARQEALLRRTLDQMDAHPDYGIRAVNAWRAGDTLAMADIYTDSRQSDPELARALFDDRHARWLPVIEQQQAPGKTLLIVVGAAHLCGKGSLMDSLEQRGYAIGQW